MRIFFASDKTPNSAFASDLWRANLYLPLVDLGHDVVEFDYDLRETLKNIDLLDPKQLAFIEENRPKVSHALLEQITAAHKAEPIDLFFSYLMDACVFPETIDSIRRLGIKTVNWYCNGSYQLHLVKEISPHYDWCLVPEKFRLGDYKAMGANPVYCQEAANPNIYKPYNSGVDFDVTFVGYAYGERPAYIKYLLDSNVDVRVWGWRWDDFSENRGDGGRPGPMARTLRIGAKLFTPAGRQAVKRRTLAARTPDRVINAAVKPINLPESIIGGVLTDDELIRMFSRSKINLGFSACGETHKTERLVQVRLRDFEVPMSGGFYMVEYMPELEEFFEIGKEIVCYSDKEDLLSKIDYYLKHDGERESIRRAGHERAVRDHSWQNRFETAFKEMGLS